VPRERGGMIRNSNPGKEKSFFPLQNAQNGSAVYKPSRQRILWFCLAGYAAWARSWSLANLNEYIIKNNKYHQPKQ